MDLVGVAPKWQPCFRDGTSSSIWVATLGINSVFSSSSSLDIVW